MKDGILELIVKFAEGEEPFETAITLVVDGFLVSGHIVSRAKYMQHSELTTKIEEGIQQARTVNGEDTPEDDGKRRFIHLRDAQYFVPGQTPTPTNGKVTCRIKLSQVSGFHFGYLSSAADG